MLRESLNELNVDKQRNFFMMNKGNNKITKLRTIVQMDFRGELSNRDEIKIE
jgi:hypothetical protein